MALILGWARGGGALGASQSAVGCTGEPACVGGSPTTSMAGTRICAPCIPCCHHVLLARKTGTNSHPNCQSIKSLPLETAAAFKCLHATQQHACHCSPALPSDEAGPPPASPANATATATHRQRGCASDAAAAHLRYGSSQASNTIVSGERRARPMRRAPQAALPLMVETSTTVEPRRVAVAQNIACPAVLSATLRPHAALTAAALPAASRLQVPMYRIIYRGMSSHGSVACTRSQAT